MNPTPVSLTDEIPSALARQLQQAQHIAVLTGAGMSAESGVPTFREAQTGLWARYDPMELATSAAFERDPRRVWDWYQWRRELIDHSRPNAGHHALAALQHSCAHVTLVTQNVDGFHQLAGSEPVLELHGNIRRSVCSRSRREIEPDWLDRHRDRSPVPSPHHPDGLARPDVVWFGEPLRADLLDAAFQAAADCDLMLVVGTSGLVQPAASIPVVAVEHGAIMVEINPAASELTRRARWHLQGSSAAWLPRLVDSL